MSAARLTTPKESDGKERCSRCASHFAEKGARARRLASGAVAAPRKRTWDSSSWNLVSACCADLADGPPWSAIRSQGLSHLMCHSRGFCMTTRTSTTAQPVSAASTSYYRSHLLMAKEKARKPIRVQQTGWPEEHELLELLSQLVERCRTKADILAPVCAQRARRDLVPKICGLDCLAAAGGSA